MTNNYAIDDPQPISILASCSSSSKINKLTDQSATSEYIKKIKYEPFALVIRQMDCQRNEHVPTRSKFYGSAVSTTNNTRNECQFRKQLN